MKVSLKKISLIIFLLISLTGIRAGVQGQILLDPPVYKEDYNRDGKVNILDAVTLLVMLRENPGDLQGDYNGSGMCEITDVTGMLANILNGALTHLGPVPVTPNSAPLAGPLAASSNWPRCTDLVTWINDIFRLEGVENSSETRKGITFYTWLRLFSRNCYGGMPQAFEGAPGNEDFVLDPHKNLFVYGWGWCDTHSRIAESAWIELTGDSTSAYRVNVRNPSGGYHTMFRLSLNGSYGAFDALYGYYLIDRDSPEARVLDWAEVGVDSNLTRNETFENRCQPFFEMPDWYKPMVLGYEPVYWDDESDWVAAGSPINQVFASPKHRLGTRYHDMSWRLPRGTTVRRYWKSDGRTWYIPLSRQGDFLPSGRFYRLADISLDGYWAKNDPNFKRAEPYLEVVPADEGYPDWMQGGRSIGQAWGSFIYEPDLAGESYLDALVSSANAAHQAVPPYITPLEAGIECEAVFDFYCPYILIEGEFTGELSAEENDEVTLELRTLQPKTQNRDEPDRWSGWTQLATGNGLFDKTLGQIEYSGGKVSIYGKYRFQLRLKARAAGSPETVGLKKLGFSLNFENGIMSIPQIFAGENTLYFEVADQGAVRAPIHVAYEYTTQDTTKIFEHTFRPRDFRDNRASCLVDVPDLKRCSSLEIRY
ncbi:MAG TPA: hypothetical protein VM123_03920 [archaeon]|nr:hypothetical protein [archaeon]